jgi:hypothetical protein
MPSGSRPVPPQAVHRDPLNTLAGTLADPATKPGRPGQARGCRAAAGPGGSVAPTRVHSTVGCLGQEQPNLPWARTGTISLDGLLAGQLAGDCHCPAVALTCPGSGTLASGERQRGLPA